jgi:hypothetical protein
MGFQEQTGGTLLLTCLQVIRKHPVRAAFSLSS